MGQQANIAVYDGQTTPALHTFTPVGVLRDSKDSITAEWVERDSSIPAVLQNRITAKTKVMGSGMTRSVLRVEMPVMDVLDQTKVDFFVPVEVISLRHPKATEAQVRKARMIALNASNNVTTSVAAATTGLAPDLLDAQIMPS